MARRSILALEDGSVFEGYAFGASGSAVGEVIFNTSITGYQEILTDPSYARQIVTLTHPHIGNVGVNADDVEAREIFSSAMVIKCLPRRISNWRSETSLPDFLRERNIVGIYGIDTRKLTRLIREKGAQNGCVMSGIRFNEKDAIQKARDFEGLKGMDLARVVSTRTSYLWNEGLFQFSGDSTIPTGGTSEIFQVAAYDFGIKENILRNLADRGCEITVVPAQTAFSELDENIDGVFLSNGPGDPEPCDYAINTIRQLLQNGVPIFGICLGHQLLGLAAGAKTIKMKFGHHGANHPVRDLKSGEILITSQNHGFTVDYNSLPNELRVTHKSLFDGTIQGLEHTQCPAFSFQGHPEASPGPHDCSYLFDRFIEMMKDKRSQPEIEVQHA